MHFDLAHALVSVLIVVVVFRLAHPLGLVRGDEPVHRSWKTFAAIAAAIFVFNLIWPA